MRAKLAVDPVCQVCNWKFATVYWGPRAIYSCEDCAAKLSEWDRTWRPKAEAAAESYLSLYDLCGLPCPNGGSRFSRHRICARSDVVVPAEGLDPRQLQLRCMSGPVCHALLAEARSLSSPQSRYRPIRWLDGDPSPRVTSKEVPALPRLKVQAYDRISSRGLSADQENHYFGYDHTDHVAALRTHASLVSHDAPEPAGLANRDKNCARLTMIAG